MFERIPEFEEHATFADPEHVARYLRVTEGANLRYEPFLKHLGTLGVSGRVLDVGAGPGVVAGRVAQAFPDAEVSALDISEEMIRVGRTYLQKKGLADRVTFYRGDVDDENSLAALGTFDLIYSTFSLHHFSDAARAIDHLMARLNDRGILYFYDFRRVCWLYWVPLHGGFFNSVRAAYRPDEMAALLDRLALHAYELTMVPPFLQHIVIRKKG